MGEMTMNKVIHAAVRRDLDRFTQALSRITTGDAARGKALQRAWETFDGHLTLHHVGEHEIAWPAMRQLGASDDLLTALDAEHEAMAAALAKAGSALAALGSEPSSSHIDRARVAVDRLREVTNAHLDHEEAETEPLMLANAGSPELKAMAAGFRKQLSAPESGAFFAWLLDDLPADAEASLRSDVPGPVLAILSGLFGRGYRKQSAAAWG